MFRPGVGVNRLGFVGWGVATIARVHEAIALAGSSSAGLDVAFDRATLPWHAGHVLRPGEDHRGLILFRRTVRSTNYGEQARLVTDFWFSEGRAWDWMNRIVCLPKSP